MAIVWPRAVDAAAVAVFARHSAHSDVDRPCGNGRVPLGDAFTTKPWSPARSISGGLLTRDGQSEVHTALADQRDRLFEDLHVVRQYLEALKTVVHSIRDVGDMLDQAMLVSSALPLMDALTGDAFQAVVAAELNALEANTQMCTLLTQSVVEGAAACSEITLARDHTENCSMQASTDICALLQPPENCLDGSSVFAALAANERPPITHSISSVVEPATDDALQASTADLQDELLLPIADAHSMFVGKPVGFDEAGVADATETTNSPQADASSDISSIDWEATKHQLEEWVMIVDEAHARNVTQTLVKELRSSHHRNLGCSLRFPGLQYRWRQRPSSKSS